MIARASELYISPDDSFTATYAGFRRRIAAAAIDWAICVVLYLIVSIPAGIVQVLPAGEIGRAHV